MNTFLLVQIFLRYKYTYITALFTKTVSWLNNIVTGNGPILEDSFNNPAHSLH